MKRLLILCAFCIAFSVNTKASIIPAETLLIINTAEVEVALDNIIQKDIFKMADFSDEDQSFNFVTQKETKFIQIFGPDGQLEYQLPILSRKVRINKNLFNKGEYKLGFMFDGHKSIEFTGVKVK